MGNMVWSAAGKRHYGDGLYKRAAEITGMTEGTLRDFVWMAGAFELSFRKDSLSFRHHKEVASIKLIDEYEDRTLELSDEPDQDKIAELLAERSMGADLAGMEKASGGQPYQNSTGNNVLPVETLRDLGISKMQSSRWQRIAPEASTSKRRRNGRRPGEETRKRL